ncbi:hypothetical protein BX611_2961 [Lutibacter oceani]|uniref:Uncharacterized protein n=1 Tax=Lutibacter oceani TaxID=1853311 RepID=A0A3D9RIN6_9FLAO|nr:hypothetical protein [Lutibacter oceani]REE78826.1 hypothetical protein BX611_2961 [Lutibacter oceani]
MNKYGLAALKAVNYYETKKDPILAWKAAVKDVFTSKSSQDKGCPRSTFFSLCEVGAVKGIPKGNYAPRVKENKVYALNALEILKNRNKNPDNIGAVDLWNLAQNQDKKYNSQMDVVLALWNKNLINL